jgi:hypothetical protein
VWGTGMTPKVLRDVVRVAATRAGIENLAPHDLRRSCARPCHIAGGELGRSCIRNDRIFRSPRPSTYSLQATNSRVFGQC